MNTIADEWAEFSKMDIPKDAPPVQREEMRRAFYAGAVAVLWLQGGIGRASHDAVMQMMRGWHDECRRFVEEDVIAPGIDLAATRIGKKN